MIEVNLYAYADIKNGFVATVLMPEMKPMPEIIMWGQRFFVKMHHDGNNWQYTEKMCYAVPRNMTKP